MCQKLTRSGDADSVNVDQSANNLFGQIGQLFHFSRPRLRRVLKVLTYYRKRGSTCSYARAGIPTYWIISLVETCLEVYTRPKSTGSEAAYDDRQALGVSGKASIVLDDESIGSVNVADLLP
jgi:hypothetical protein